MRVYNAYAYVRAISGCKARLGSLLDAHGNGKMSETSVKISKNEIGCREDTVPKTVDTRRHCKVWLTACNNLPQPPPYISVFGSCGRLLHALNHTLQCLLVSTVFGTVSSLYTSCFIFTLVATCRNSSILVPLTEWEVVDGAQREYKSSGM